MDARDIYKKKYWEIRKIVDEKEVNDIKVSDQEYAMLEKYDIIADKTFNLNDKILTKAEEDALVAEGKRKLETENPYWNEYNSVKIELINYEKTHADRKSTKYKELVNKWRRYEALISSYEYSRGSSIEAYEKAHPISGNITPDSRELSINKTISAQANNFSFNSGINSNFSLNDIDRGKGNLSSTMSGGASYNKNNFSINANADVGLYGTTESSISLNYNLNANASYNYKDFLISGNLSKNISSESDMSTKQISLSRAVSNFNISASHTVNDMVFSEMSSQTSTTTANVNYNKGKLSLNTGYSFMKTESPEFNQLANTVSIGGSYNYKNMNYNMNTDLLIANGEVTPTYSASGVYTKDKLMAGLNASYISGEFSSFGLGSNIAYSKENLMVKADVQYTKGQKPTGMLSVRATF